jgi:transketolase
MALSAKRTGRSYRTVALLSDGECDEGSTWEAVLFAPQHRLDNLVAIVDYNGIQSFGAVADVLDLAPLADKWRAFRWGVREIDGHDHAALATAFAGVPFEPGRPSAVIARTVKGKGVSFMENELAWHYRSPSDAELAVALAELGEPA